MLLAKVVAILFAVPTLVATAAFYVAARGRPVDCDAGPPLSLGAATLAFGREWLASLGLLIAALLPARTANTAGTAGRVAVLLPELRGSSRSFWYLRRRLRSAGWTCVAGLPRTKTPHVADAAAALDACLARLPAGTEIVLVGHGIGGIVAHRYAQQRSGLPIRHVVTLATPHRGSTGMPYRLLCGSAQPVPAPPDAADIDVIAVYSGFDAWLVPTDDAYCAGGFNIEVRGIGHCTMLFSRRVADLIVENITAPAHSQSRPVAAGRGTGLRAV